MPYGNYIEDIMDIKKEDQKQEENCIFCGKELPEGYGHICDDCKEKIFYIKVRSPEKALHK